MFIEIYSSLCQIRTLHSLLFGHFIHSHNLFHGLAYVQSLETDTCFLPSMRSSVGVTPSKEHTSIELTGTDRPGLLSEVCAVLTDLGCSVVKAEVWTHNARAAAVVHVKDECTGSAIEDPKRLTTIKALLCNVLRGNNDRRTANMTVSLGVTHTERRLHQMMFADRDYERVGMERNDDKSSRPHVALLDCTERDYTVVTMKSKDRPKLLFDTVCTLTDMQYVVFHGTVETGRMEAYQVKVIPRPYVVSYICCEMYFQLH